MTDGELARRCMAVPIDEDVETLARGYLRGGGGQLARLSPIGLGDQVMPFDTVAAPDEPDHTEPAS